MINITKAKNNAMAEFTLITLINNESVSESRKKRTEGNIITTT